MVNYKMKAIEQKITKDMTMGEIMTRFPEAVEVLFGIGLGCAMCHGASFETVEQGCKVHGMTDNEIDELVKKLNEKVNK